MRISTAQMFKVGVESIQQQQASLSKTQQQLATGRRILSPSDDPPGAVSALTLNEALSSIDQYARNAGVAQSRLTREESTLDQFGTALQRVRELAVQGGNAALDGVSRNAIAAELRQLSDGLLDLANTSDANGEHLFAGFRSQNQPFVRNAGGAVEYLGDQGSRKLELSPDRAIAVADSGNAFMTVPRGNGTFVVTPDTANTGTAHVAAAEVVDPSAIDGQSYTVEWLGPDSYEVRDAGGSVVSSGTLVAGQALDIGGRRIAFAGTPAAGDQFHVEPAGQSSIFAMVDALAALLEAPGSDAAAGAQRSDGLALALGNIDQALGRVQNIRTSVGARLQAIDAQGLVNDDTTVQLKVALSDLQDLDYGEAVGRFQLQQVALQAAQQTYAQINGLSLFNFIR